MLSDQMLTTTREALELMKQSLLDSQASNEEILPAIARIRETLAELDRLAAQDAPAAPLDFPDGPGWWAFEGYHGDNPNVATCIDVVWLHNLELGIVINTFDRHEKLDEYHGKWWKLTMPWEQAAAPPQADVPQRQWPWSIPGSMIPTSERTAILVEEILKVVDRIEAAQRRPAAPPQENVREALAAYAHEAWSGWMRYLFSKCDIRTGYFSNGEVVCLPAWAVERWQRQMETSYADLPESEKELDRAEADKMLAILRGQGG